MAAIDKNGGGRKKEVEIDDDESEVLGDVKQGGDGLGNGGILADDDLDNADGGDLEDLLGNPSSVGGEGREATWVRDLVGMIGVV